MIPEVESAEHVAEYTIHLRFTDGSEGDVDLRNELHGEPFEPLKDVQQFKRFSVHPEFRTLCWPNGADFAPEFLYERIQVHATPA